jgi:hypothetical protein
MDARAEAMGKTDRALALAAMCRIVFAGEDPDAVGAALAETMATFLHGHRIVGDDREEREMREAIFQHWIKTVRDLMLIYDKPVGPTQ